MRMKPLSERPELTARMKQSAKDFAALSQIERDALIADQAASFVRGETGQSPENPNYARELITARTTIRELEKRIGELEAERASLLDGLGELNGWLNPRAKLDAIVAAGLEANDALDAAEQALTAERQRREELESVVLMLEHDSGKTNEEINAAASAYVSKYLTPTPHPTQEQTP